MWLYQQNCMSPSDKKSSAVSKGMPRRALSPQPTFMVCRKARHRGGRDKSDECSEDPRQRTQTNFTEERSMAPARKGSPVDKQSMVSVELYGAADTPRGSMEVENASRTDHEMSDISGIPTESKAQGDCSLNFRVQMSVDDSQYLYSKRSPERASKREKVDDEVCSDAADSAQSFERSSPRTLGKEKRKELLATQVNRKPSESTGAKPKARRIPSSPSRIPKAVVLHGRHTKHIMAADYRDVAGGDLPPRSLTSPGPFGIETPKLIKSSYRPLNQIISVEGTPGIPVSEFRIQPNSRTPRRVLNLSQQSSTPKISEIEEYEPEPVHRVSPTALQYQASPEPKSIKGEAEILLIDDVRFEVDRLGAGGQEEKEDGLISNKSESEIAETISQPRSEQAEASYLKVAQGNSEKLAHRSPNRWWRSGVVRAGIATLAVLGVIAISIAILSETSNKTNSVKSQSKSDMPSGFSYRFQQCLADPPPPQNSCEKWNWSGTTRVIGIVITYRCSTLENFPVIRVAECDAKQTWNVESIGIGVCDCPKPNTTR